MLTYTILFSVSKKMKEVSPKHELHDDVDGISVNTDTQYFHYICAVDVSAIVGNCDPCLLLILWLTSSMLPQRQIFSAHREMNLYEGLHEVIK